MSDLLIPPRFLFRVALPLRRVADLSSKQAPSSTGKAPSKGKATAKGKGTAKRKGSGLELPAAHRLVHLGQLDGAAELADVRAGWSEAGLCFSVRVAGKRQPAWCRESRLEESDGLQVWIDTRATHNIHRASRFCHRFAFLPGGGGPRYDRPVADQLIIGRARENARPVRPQDLHLKTEQRIDGYLLRAVIPASALTGFDPAEHPRLGFNYALLDRELGLQTLSIGSGFPYDSDPSTWATLEMVKG